MVCVTKGWIWYWSKLLLLISNEGSERLTPTTGSSRGRGDIEEDDMGGWVLERWGPGDEKLDRNGGSFQPCLDPGFGPILLLPVETGWRKFSITLLVSLWGGLSKGTVLRTSGSLVFERSSLFDGREENSELAGLITFSLGFRGVLLTVVVGDEEFDWTGTAGANVNGLPPVNENMVPWRNEYRTYLWLD